MTVDVRHVVPDFHGAELRVRASLDRHPSANTTCTVRQSDLALVLSVLDAVRRSYNEREEAMQRLSLSTAASVFDGRRVDTSGMTPVGEPVPPLDVPLHERGVA